MTPRTPAILLIFTMACFAFAGPATAQDPKVPPADDPGGIAIGLTGAGVDYTDPEIATGLARDGEGNIVGWDFVDNDIFPYSADAGSNGHAKLMLSHAGVEVVPFRIAEPNHVAMAAAFLSQTPAGILVVTASSKEQKDWELFAAAANRFPHLLFLVPAGGKDGDFPAAFSLPNVLAVAARPADTSIADLAYISPQGPETSDVEAAIGLAAALALSCEAGGKTNGADRKTRILEQHTTREASQRLPVFKPCG